VVATTGTTTSTCTPAASTTSPQSFRCTAITQDTTVPLTVTLGTGANSTAIERDGQRRSNAVGNAGTMPARVRGQRWPCSPTQVFIAGGTRSQPDSGREHRAHFDPRPDFTLAGKAHRVRDQPAHELARYQGSATVSANGKVLTAGLDNGTTPES